MLPGELAVLTATHEYAYGELGSPPTIPPMATLRFEVELLDWQADAKVLAPGITKVVEEEGRGWKVIAIGGTVELRVVGRLGSAEGPVFLDSSDAAVYERLQAAGAAAGATAGELVTADGVRLSADGVVSLSVDSAALNEALETMLVSMKPGERATFHCAAAEAGDGGLPALQRQQTLYQGVPVGDAKVDVVGRAGGGLVLALAEGKEEGDRAGTIIDQVVYEIHCLHGDMPKEGWELSVDEKLKVAAEMKDVANKLFAAKQLKRAGDRCAPGWQRLLLPCPCLL